MDELFAKIEENQHRQFIEKFHEFLKLQNEIGNITRQEAFSMVPTLLLDVHSDHFVLNSKQLVFGWLQETLMLNLTLLPTVSFVLMQ
ncbi:hypothetical protein RIF29_35602 [Crotalaria pallida]|uniref:Uncharacterized protein n=1 Tax=Crotalaria pallida TaxID=3830 RepID=A0AAN9EAK9_CROPI